jgi:two-component system nitrogen regulation sensor histidine kinase NtrY
LWLYFLLFVLSGLVATLFWRLSQLPPTAASGVLVNVLVGLNALLLLTLVFVVGRSLIKLLIERRSGRRGFKLQTKVMIGILPLTIVPGALMFFFSSQFLSKTLQTFSLDSNIQTVIHQSHAFQEAVLDRYARNAIAAIKAKAKEQPRPDWPVFLAAHGITGLELFSEEQRNTPKERFLSADLIPADRALIYLHEESWTESPNYSLFKNGSMIWRFPFQLEDVPAHLLLVLPSPYTDAFLYVVDSYSFLDHAAVRLKTVRTATQSTLLIITLAIIFAGIWLGRYFARSHLGALNTLIHSTDLVAQGNMDARIEVHTGDELEDVADSFNSMVTQLHQNRLALSAHAQAMEGVNEELKRQNETIESILREINAGIMVIRSSGEVLRINPAFRGFSWLPATARLSHVADVEPEALRTTIEKLLAEVNQVTPHKTVHLELLGQPGPGSVEPESRHFALTILPLIDKDFLVVLEDLSPLLNAQKLAAWKEVAQRVAHEFKNPLTPIVLNSQRVYRKAKKEDNPLLPVIEQSYHTIAAQVEVLKNLVGQFQQFAKLPEVKKEAMDLCMFMKEVIDGLRPVFPRVHFSLSLSEPHLMVHADRNLLHQVMGNLVQNGVRAMKEEGTISITVERAPQGVHFSVSDTGPGIPAGLKKKVFVPYFSKDPKGSGLGLAIVQQIIQDHGGTISVSDAPPQGARFDLFLPR